MVSEIQTLEEFLDVALQSTYTNGALIVGSAGLRKSHLVVHTLKSKGIRFSVYNSHVSALGLYEALYYHRDEVLVLDDVEELFKDQKAVGILKAALFSVDQKREVVWASTAKVLNERNLPNRFEFFGKIIIIMNDMPAKKSESLKALESRLFVYKMSLPLDVRKILIRSIILKQDIFGLTEKEKEFVLDYIEGLLNLANTENYNLRTAIKACEVYKIKGEAGLPLIQRMMIGDEKLIKFLRIEEKGAHLTQMQKIEVWKRATGLSTQSYYNIRAKYLANKFSDEDALLKELESVDNAIAAIGGCTQNISETNTKECG